MAWTVLRPFVLPRALDILRREIERPRSPAEWLDFTTTFHRQLFAPRRLQKRFSIEPSQIRPEILAWLDMVAAARPRRVMEIGTSNGGVFFLLARSAAPDAELIGLDLPRAAGAGGKDGVPLWKERLIRGFAGAGQRIDLVLGDSHASATLERVKHLLGGRELDVLFIDGDHSYAGVKQDFQDYAPLVRAGGLIGLHDIVPDARTRKGTETENDSGDVHRFWAELKHEHAVTELIEDIDQDGFGIGVIHLAHRLSPAPARAWAAPR